VALRVTERGGAGAATADAPPGRRTCGPAATGAWDLRWHPPAQTHRALTASTLNTRQIRWRAERFGTPPPLTPASPLSTREHQESCFEALRGMCRPLGLGSDALHIVCRRLSASVEALSHHVQTPQRQRRGPFTLCADASAPAQRPLHTVCRPLGSGIRGAFQVCADASAPAQRLFHIVCRRLSAGAEALSHCVQTPQRRRRGPFLLCARPRACVRSHFRGLQTSLTGHP
jgi:hypothetical protein